MDPSLPGYCYSFYEYKRNGIRAIMHEGDISGFSSLIFMIPSENVGFFFAANRELESGTVSNRNDRLNSLGNQQLMTNPKINSLRQKLIEKFLDKFYPPPETDALPQVMVLMSLFFSKHP
jgi:hypothetical protein